MLASLICHPDTPPVAVEAIEATIGYDNGRWLLSFVAQGAVPLIPPRAASVRVDGLWKTTCFELFVRGQAEDYAEFNFSPSTRWAAYRFARYRAGISKLPVTAPHIEPIEGGVRVTLHYAMPNAGHQCIGLAAVIEEIDGTKSYWALAHPPGKPDFHHPDCFALTLPPPA